MKIFINEMRIGEIPETPPEIPPLPNPEEPNPKDIPVLPAEDRPDTFPIKKPEPEDK